MAFDQGQEMEETSTDSFAFCFHGFSYRCCKCLGQVWSSEWGDVTQYLGVTEKVSCASEFFNIPGEKPCLLESLSSLSYLWVWKGAGSTRDPVVGSPLHSAPRSGQKPCVADYCSSNTSIRLLDLPYSMFFSGPVMCLSHGDSEDSFPLSS